MPARSTASAAWTTARRSPTTTKKRSPASTRCPRSLAYAEWNKHKINFIDTPGMANFLSDARAALRVADAALVVVDAVAGVEVSTEKVWAAADELELPRLVVLNRLDRERASLERSLESLRAVFGRAVVPMQLPIGEEKGFRGVVDLVAMKAWTFATDGSGKPTEGADSRRAGGARRRRAREALIEMVAEADDALMEKFFDAGTLTQEELRRGLKRGDRGRRGSSRVLCTSATAQHRHAAAARRDRRLRAVAGRAAVQARRRQDRRARSRVEAADNGPAAAFVWKTVADPFAGRITMFRVVSGTLKADSTVQNVTQGRARAARPLRAAAGQDADERARDQGRRHRRRREAEGDADQRPARRQGGRRSRCRRSSSRSR